MKTKIIINDLKIQDLQEKQKKLDIYIHKNNNINITKINTFQKRLLSLIVEISELSNETMCFKYWKKNKQINQNLVSEEFSDCLHFFLSIANDLEINLSEVEIFYSKGDLTKIILDLIRKIVQLDFLDEQKFIDAFCFFINLGLNLGLDCKDIYMAYIRKNVINIQRQQNNY